MINNPISVQVNLLRIQQLTLPYTTSTEESLLIKSNTVLVQATPLGFQEEITHQLALNLLIIFYAEGTCEFVVGLFLEAFSEGLFVVDLFLDLLVGMEVGVLGLEGWERRAGVGSGSVGWLLWDCLHLSWTFFLFFGLLFPLLLQVNRLLLQLSNYLLPILTALRPIDHRIRRLALQASIHHSFSLSLPHQLRPSFLFEVMKRLIHFDLFGGEFKQQTLRVAHLEGMW